MGRPAATQFAFVCPLEALNLAAAAAAAGGAAGDEGAGAARDRYNAARQLVAQLHN